MYKLPNLILLLFLASCGFQSDESTLRTTISEMVELIDTGQDQKLLSEYAYFDVRKGIPSKIPENKRKKIRGALVRAKELEPVLSENNTLAIYESAVFDKPLRFIKHQGKWRLMN